MGAITNIAPELFAGVQADVPFVDNLTTMLKPELPLTVIERDEWGDPLASKEVYEYMKSYAPYENIRSNVKYPKILVTTSLNDTRVLYVEPAKWVAKLRDMTQAEIYFKIEMVAGHAGTTGRYSKLKEIAFEQAWALGVLLGD
jgi:oligopeptidase B